MVSSLSPRRVAGFGDVSGFDVFEIRISEIEAGLDFALFGGRRGGSSGMGLDVVLLLEPRPCGIERIVNGAPSLRGVRTLLPLRAGG